MSQVGRYSRRLTGGNPGYPAGTRNGRIPLTLLRRAESQPHLGEGACLWPAAAIGLDRMYATARQAGIALTLVAGYRDFADQQRLRRQWAARGRANMAARPGYSSHGWGTAIDVQRHTAATRGIVPWLMEHATAFGWDHPRWAGDGVGAEEPWHWQFVRGWEPEAEMEEVAVALAIPGAEGIIEGGQGLCWVRPLATALGATIGAVGPDFVDLRRGTRQARVPAVMRDGKALIRLDSLAGIGLEADWVRAVVLREVT